MGLGRHPVRLTSFGRRELEPGLAVRLPGPSVPGPHQGRVIGTEWGLRFELVRAGGGRGAELGMTGLESARPLDLNLGDGLLRMSAAPDVLVLWTKLLYREGM